MRRTHTGFAASAFAALQRDGYLPGKPNGTHVFEARAMTVAHYDISLPRSFSFEGVRTLFDTALLFAKRRIVVARTVSELSNLSDAQLDDIGVTRGRIHELSAEMAARTVL